jgi:hypothetical protein
MRKPVCWPRWGDEREMTAAIHRAGGNDTAFAQIIEFRTSNLKATQEAANRSGRRHGRQAHGTAAYLVPGPQRGNRYFNVVFSGSYESAVQNSSLPETQRTSQEMMSYTHGAPTFYHPGTIEDRSQPAGA